MPPARLVAQGCAAVALVSLGLAVLAACGYRMDAPGLPDGHRTLAVATVRNLTFTAELDVRLQRALRRRLLRDAAIRTVSPARSELLLEVSLERLSTSRARSVNETTVSRLVYRLGGHITLREPASGRVLIDRRPIAAESRLNFAERTVETPAVRDEGLNDAIDAFADEVVQALLVDF